MNGRPKRRNKAALTNFFAVVWIGPQCQCARGVHNLCKTKSIPTTLRWRNLRTQQSPVILILHLCLSKTRAGEYYDNRNVIVFEKFRFQTVFEIINGLA